MNDFRGAPWELGSDFDLGSAYSIASSGEQSLPWSRPDEPVTYIESGRQALTLLSRHLRLDGYSKLLMPRHFCDSMVAPFLTDEWTVEFVAVDEAWRSLPPAAALSDPERTLIFSMSYFGVDESPEWIDFISCAGRRGAVIVSDESHRVMGPGLEIADFRIASLRKMLPVPDGAFLTGISAQVQNEGRQAGLRMAAMRRKSEYLAGLRSAGHLPLFRKAEAVTDIDVAPARMSADSKELLERFDYARMKEIRQKNHRAVSSAIIGTGFSVTTGDAPVPSHCVIAGLGVHQLRSFLIGNRIFCPVHWPPSEVRTQVPGSWRNDVLSIPIDHRYSVDDMEMVVAAIRQFASLGQE